MLPPFLLVEVVKMENGKNSYSLHKSPGLEIWKFMVHATNRDNRSRCREIDRPTYHTEELPISRPKTEINHTQYS